MKKRIISILIILLIIGGFIANQLITYARTAETPLYVNLTATDLSGTGYGIGDPNNAGKYIWNIMSYNSENTADVSETQRNLYCVNADYGKTWFGTDGTQGDQSKILSYELYYDIQSERNSLLDNLQNDENDMLKTLLNPEESQYRQLLWLFDNFYIPGKTNINEFL